MFFFKRPRAQSDIGADPTETNFRRFSYPLNPGKLSSKPSDTLIYVN